MSDKKETRGGPRFKADGTPAGGRPKNPDKKRTIQVVLSPGNAAFLEAMGREKSGYVDNLLDEIRATT